MLANDLSFSPLLEDACRAMERCHWKDARCMLEGVLAADPENTTANRLMATINRRLPQNQGGALSSWPISKPSQNAFAYDAEPKVTPGLRYRLQSVFGVLTSMSRRG